MDLNTVYTRRNPICGDCGGISPLRPPSEVWKREGMFLRDGVKDVRKIVVIGDFGSGKSTLHLRFQYGYFSQTMESVHRVKQVTVEDNQVWLDLWDTVGQERHDSLTSSFYRGAVGALLIYDVTSRSSFDHVSKWLDQIRQRCSEDVKVTLVGTKSDKEEERQVSFKEGRHFAEVNHIPFFEVSAKTGENAFMSTVERPTLKEVENVKEEGTTLKEFVSVDEKDVE
ncbi:putative Rab2 family GTPase [Planoprotostelium fungivorum]|uniref:Putative Rab2 family GTPase n=1 Tax=Planoprotostelium fungivorum TaxID=1890364 RepID=A0A2P6MND5_9EUKA|nr:putative Rab2 family GTPase [Planoprotostelium fungivorum]